jgi:hypothetical protein
MRIQFCDSEDGTFAPLRIAHKLARAMRSGVESAAQSRKQRETADNSRGTVAVGLRGEVTAEN